MEMTGGEAVVQSLLREGVEVVFGIPGVHTLEIYDHFLDHPELRHIVVRHEQGASLLADGYARATGKVGVCTLITGPGLTNASTGIAQAYSDSTPMLVLSSQNPTNHIDQDRGLLHDLKDQSRMMDSICAYSETVYRVKDIPEAVRRAFRYLRTHRPRPVHLEFPIDVLAQRENVQLEPVGEDDLPPVGDERRVTRLAEVLLESERPLLLVGGGCNGAAEEVRRLARTLHMPVVTTTNGKGVFPESDPLSLGANLRSDAVREFMANRDVVLAVGTELAGNETSEWSVPMGTELYHIDIDYRNFNRGYETAMGIVGDASRTLRRLLAALEGRLDGRPERDDAALLESLRSRLVGFDADEAEEWRVILKVLKETLAPDAIVVNDMTMLCYRATGSYPVDSPRTFLFPRGLGTLGFSVPAAFGAKLGQPERQVVALTGDGGFLYTSNELATAVKYSLGVPVLLLNNESYGVVKMNQLRRYSRSIACDIVNPDFVTYASSFGARAVRIQSEELADRLPHVLSVALKQEVPTLIELPVSF